MDLINVDFDGVLIPNYFEKKLIDKGLSEGLPQKISQFDGRTFEWYIQMVNESDFAPLNIPFLRLLSEIKDRFAIRLWTNRNVELKQKTIDNLGDWRSMFDSFHFYSGSKGDSRVDGIVVDNTPKYLGCGQFGIHYEWR